MVKSIPFVPLHGRSNEASKIYNLIIDSISKKTPLSIYVGGKPGTGKTATLRQIIDSLSVKKNVENVYMSCTSCQSKVQLYREITLKFLNKTFPSCTALKNIEKFFNEQDKFILLVLDEIDFLTSKSQEMLYMVFDWPAMFPGKVGVVGIANTLDLPKRLLPKLKKGTIPVTVEFQPYSKDELIEILTEHLKDENFGMDGKNIEFIARKIALKSGDVRTALSVTKKTLLDLQEDDDEIGNDENNAFKEPVLETPKPKKNALTVVMSTIRNIEASPLVRAKIPLQPKIILAILLRLTSKKKGISLTETLILSAYQKTQSLLKLPELKRNELIDALSVLESQGLVSYYKNKLILNVDASTAKIVISDNVLIGEIDKINF